MFKNKSKIAKKLVMFVATSAIPLGIVAASSHASAMNYSMLSKLLARERSVPTAGIVRRPVVQPKVVKIDILMISRLNDQQLIEMVSKEMQQGNHIEFKDGIFGTAVAYHRFGFCRFLVDNKLIDVNENIYDAYKRTPLSILVTSLNSRESIDNVVDLIKHLVDNHGARLNGMHYYNNPLVFAFFDLACGHVQIDYCTAKMIEVLEFLISRGMDINALSGNEGNTIRYEMEKLLHDTNRSSEFHAIYRCVIEHKCKLWVN